MFRFHQGDIPLKQPKYSIYFHFLKFNVMFPQIGNINDFHQGDLLGKQAKELSTIWGGLQLHEKLVVTHIDTIQYL